LTVIQPQPFYELLFGILPKDDLTPLSNKGKRWLHSAATTERYKTALDEIFYLVNSKLGRKGLVTRLWKVIGLDYRFTLVTYEKLYLTIVQFAVPSRV